MTDNFEARRKAAEESYFQKQEQEALLRLKAKQEQAKAQARLSPITGKPMEHVSIQGIVVDRCVDSGGIFLDAGELEEIIKAAKAEHSSSWLDSFIAKIKI